MLINLHYYLRKGRLKFGNWNSSDFVVGNNYKRVVRDYCNSLVRIEIPSTTLPLDQVSAIPTHKSENLTPKETLSYIAKTGITRGNRSSASIFYSSLIGGSFLSVAGLLLLKVGGGTLPLMTTMPGAHALLCGMVFPIGLVMLVMTGADLLTSNMMYATMPFIHAGLGEFNKQVVLDVCRYSLISLLGNFIACISIAAVFATTYGVGSVATFASGIAVAKTSSPFLVAFWKGIFANWLVNIAVLMQASTSNVVGKVILIWIPISTFVTLGFEHCVANMFLIPFGIFSGADVAWSAFFLGNLFPVILGNFVGAAMMVSLLHSKAFMK
jgi:formate/nitrite transporter